MKKPYTDKRSDNPMDFCNTCFHCWVEGDGWSNIDECQRQSLSNRSYLATMKDGEVIQECCEQCAQEVMDMVE